MSGAREELLSTYAEWRTRLSRFLARRLGNADLAADLTQDMWLRLSTGALPGTVANPASYLFRIAANLAVDHRRAERRRRLTAQDIEEALDVADEAPDPEAIAASRDDIHLLQNALAELPQRRREIFFLCRINGLAQRDIAARYGITVRTVENEILRALTHCRQRLNRK